MPDKVEQLTRAAAEFGAPIPPEIAEKLVKLAGLVLAANERVKLTAITEWEDVLAKHLLDSLAAQAVGAAPRPGQALCDLGSGGGFPGMVEALLEPSLQVTLLEATQKKAEFLKMAAAELAVDKVQVWAERSEEAGRSHGREAFDLVTARAVAELRILVELALPLLKTGGQLLAWKGPDAAAEIEKAGAALAALGGEVERVAAYALPGGLGERRLIFIRKRRPVSAGFPRRPGMAEKKPL